MAKYLVWRNSEVDKLLNSPRGTVGRYLALKGSIVIEKARAQVGKRTGRLAASIHMRHSRAPYGQILRIGSSVPYALAHHEGTRPHVITTRPAHHLRFSDGGRVVYSRQVLHPGTKPNRYLTDNLHLVK